MTIVRTPKSPPYHLPTKKTIWIINSGFFILVRHAGTRHYAPEGFHWHRNGAMPILSFHALCFQIPQHQKGTFEVAKRFMKAIVFTKNPWPIILDHKYSMVQEAWILEIEAQDCQRALAGAPVGTPSGCQFPGGPSLKIDPQTREAVSLEFCITLLYQTYGYWLPLKIYIVETEHWY